MYPNVIQFETRRLEVERQLALDADRHFTRPLSGLPRGERRLLARIAPAVAVPAGRTVVRQGESAESFFLIESGRASVLRNHRSVAVLEPGEFFGEIALLGGGARTASVVAATDLSLRIVPRRDFERAMRTLPTLAHAVRSVGRQRLFAAP